VGGRSAQAKVLILDLIFPYTATSKPSDRPVPGEGRPLTRRLVERGCPEEEGPLPGTKTMAEIKKLYELWSAFGGREFDKSFQPEVARALVAAKRPT